MRGLRRSFSAAAVSTRCPPATLAFVGRHVELERILGLLDDAALFLICGVAGIGKSELAYRAIELIGERGDWTSAERMLIQVERDTDEEHLIAVLRLRFGAPGGGRGGSLAEKLEPVVRALSTRPHLLVLDDVHHIGASAAGEILGHLGR